MRRIALAVLLALAACTPVADEGFRVYSTVPYDPTIIETKWAAARDCQRMDGERPWTYIYPMPIIPGEPNTTGIYDRHGNRVLVEPSLYSLDHEFTHALLWQNTGSVGRHVPRGTPGSCFGVAR